jgi:hypothetical protein
MQAQALTVTVLTAPVVVVQVEHMVPQARLEQTVAKAM